MRLDGTIQVKIASRWRWPWLPVCVLLLGAAAIPMVEQVGQLADPTLDEISGLAVSRRQPGVYWAHNDSFGADALFALRASGERLAQVQVLGAPNIDWEDLASFELDGVAYLAVADIGNNLGADEALHIHVLPEPGLDDASVRVQWSVRFRFSDGPRDAEGLAADVRGRRFLISDKGRRPAGLYALPMQPGAGEQRAQRIADLPFVWPERPEAPPPGQLTWRATPTALDLSADGRRLLLLTYRHVMAFSRRGNEDWPAALQRQPQWARLPEKLGYEAATWNAEGTQVLLTHEQPRARLFRWQPPAP
jgi:hypothetical protein